MALFLLQKFLRQKFVALAASGPIFRQHSTTVVPAQHEEHGLCQTLQYREVALVKSKGEGRENLQYSDHLALVPDRCGRYRANTESPADRGFDAGIGLGIVATQGFSCTYALPGKT